VLLNEGVLPMGKRWTATENGRLGR